MKAFVINSEERTIEEVEYSGDYRDIYRLGDFDHFEVAGFNSHGDGVYVDGDGLFKVGQYFFSVRGYPQPLAGNGVVLGCNEEGETVEPTVTLDWLRNNVIWYGKRT